MMFRVEDPELLLALHALYQFEAERTSGPRGAPVFVLGQQKVVAETSIDGDLLSSLIEFPSRNTRFSHRPAVTIPNGTLLAQKMVRTWAPSRLSENRTRIQTSVSTSKSSRPRNGFRPCLSLDRE